MLLYVVFKLFTVVVAYEIQERAILQPLDHFSGSLSAESQFLQRYFVSDQYYSPGGPILIYSVGERTAQASDLSDGWISELARETGGLALLLEQRFYGDSIPDPAHSNGTDVWQYLSVEQMMADIRRFAEQIKRMAPFRHGRAPVVLVGGSFAGSLIVWTKQRYPDFESFAIASSAPLKIVDGYWEFDRMVAGRLPCAKTLSLAVRTIDEILDREDSTQTAALKRRFGLEHVENDADFVAALAIQVSALMQSAQNKGSIAGYCSQIEPPSAKAVDGVEALARVTREYGRFHRIVPVGECPGRSDDLAWLWQQCTELGMWQTAPSPNSSVAAEAAWFAHRLRSRRLDVGHYRRQCDKCLPLVRNNQPAYRKAQFRIFARRTLDSYTRWVPSDALLTAGDLDPWLHLTAVWGGGRRTDNTLLIGNASHAEDLLSVAENGSENPEVRNARNRIIQAVEQWSLKHKQRAEHQGYRHALLVIGSGGIQIGAAFAVLCALVAKYAL